MGNKTARTGKRRDYPDLLGRSPSSTPTYQIVRNYMVPPGITNEPPIEIRYTAT